MVVKSKQQEGTGHVVKLAKVEPTEHSGKYYYYFVDDSGIFAYVPEKRFLAHVAELIGHGKPVTITHNPSMKVENVRGSFGGVK